MKTVNLFAICYFSLNSQLVCISRRDNASYVQGTVRKRSGRFSFVNLYFILPHYQGRIMHATKCTILSSYVQKIQSQYIDVIAFVQLIITRRHCSSLVMRKNAKCRQPDFSKFASKPEVHSISEMFVFTKWTKHVLFCLAYLVQIR